MNTRDFLNESFVVFMVSSQVLTDSYKIYYCSTLESLAALWAYKIHAKSQAKVHLMARI